MLLSDTSIKRPVFASVLALILVIFGLVSFERLQPLLRMNEYPSNIPNKVCELIR